MDGPVDGATDGAGVRTRDLVVVVTGLPGAGKTTLARALAAALVIPVISKDVIKESLFDALGSGSVEWSRTLGRAGHLVMYALARDMPEVVLDAHFQRGVAEEDLLALGRPLVQVWCDCPLEVAVARYRDRASSPERHWGHRPEHQSDAATERWRTEPPRPLDLGSPLVTVDTAGPVSAATVAHDVRRLAATG